VELHFKLYFDATFVIYIQHQIDACHKNHTFWNMPAHICS